MIENIDIRHTKSIMLCFVLLSSGGQSFCYLRSVWPRISICVTRVMFVAPRNEVHTNTSTISLMQVLAELRGTGRGTEEEEEEGGRVTPALNSI